MNFKRSERVRELLRHEISLYVQGIKDPHLGFVTITGVDVSDDLTDAKVYFSVFGSSDDRKVSTEILRESVPAMRHYLGRKLESLYRPPTLDFRYDETPERAHNILTILNQLNKEREEESRLNGSPKPQVASRSSRASSVVRKKKQSKAKT